jgi:hypothetical protein
VESIAAPDLDQDKLLHLHGQVSRPDPGERRLKHLSIHVQWPDETNLERGARRMRLTECDRLLTKIEEHNLASDGPVPRALIAWYCRLGGHCSKTRVRGDVLIEAVFALQEQLVRQPILPEEATVSRRRRLALR